MSNYGISHNMHSTSHLYTFFQLCSYDSEIIGLNFPNTAVGTILVSGYSGTANLALGYLHCTPVECINSEAESFQSTHKCTSTLLKKAHAIVRATAYSFLINEA